MNKSCFFDSNILIYAMSDDYPKNQIAQELLNTHHVVISTQVLNEFCNVMIKKRYVDFDKLTYIISAFANDYDILTVDTKLAIHALNIKAKYHYSYWDSLMIACALQANTPILYSEDMHHNHIIENKLTIINPFYKENP